MKYFAIIFIVVYLLAHVYLGIRGWQALSRLYLLRPVFVVVLTVLFIAPLITFGFEEALPIKVNYIFQQIAGVWIILFIYLLMITFLIDVVRWILIEPKLISGAITRYYGKSKIFTFVGVIIFVTITAIGGYIRFINPKIIKKTIIDKRITQPLRLVMASDMHLGYNIGNKHLQRFVDMINAQKPDIVLLVGDVVDRSLLPVMQKKMYKQLATIESVQGVYAVCGNHDGFVKDSMSLKDFFSRSNINLLADEYVSINDEITIVGRKDYSNKKRKPLNAILGDFSGYTVVMDHQPRALKEATNYGADMLLCGHTHAGQIWPGNIIVDWMYKVGYGYKRINNTDVIVSSGLGLWGGLFRIGTNSELVVIDLKNENE